MELINILIPPFLIVFSLGMFITALASYFRSKNSKLIFVSIVFLIFLIKGILMSLGLLYQQELAPINSLTNFGILDVIVLFFLFIATLKR
jgi:hypothetical protein